jgi:hypothetical protein
MVKPPEKDSRETVWRKLGHLLLAILEFIFPFAQH